MLLSSCVMAMRADMYGSFHSKLNDMFESMIVGIRSAKKITSNFEAVVTMCLVGGFGLSPITKEVLQLFLDVCQKQKFTFCEVTQAELIYVEISILN